MDTRFISSELKSTDMITDLHSLTFREQDIVEICRHFLVVYQCKSSN